ncbi:MAG TPA: M20/M25/M40 family metallo-hydrolase [Thermoleophilaceae bacterium]|nr:M20/M25/M40 family metallo-hydrolase [Thermoleophilaceae bacterium]
MAPIREELEQWLRIPSVSTGGGDAGALNRACDWVLERIEAAGGRAERVVLNGSNPMAVGELRASRPDAPTVLSYGHYDVQDPGPLDAWESPPFEPTERGGRLYARGAADDKGNFLPLLHVACELARAGELPVNVRLLVEGEEEIGSDSVLRYLREQPPEVDAAIVFDSLMADESTPAINTGARGLVQGPVEVRTAGRDLHSGLYGGAVLNATHVLMEILRELLPGPDGRVRQEFRAGVATPGDAERESWARLPSGAEMLAEAGAVEVTAGAAAEFWERTGAEPALDVNMLSGGEPRTVIPSVARAQVSLRLAPGQRAEQIAAELERLLRAAAPEGVELQVHLDLSDPALFDAAEPALQLAAGAFERACGTPPAFVRLGGTLPLLAVLAEQGTPTIVSGFALGADAFHAPNESYRLESLRLGELTARELYRSLADLPR